MFLQDVNDELVVTGFYAIKQDFGLKIVGEMHFSLFFRESAKFLSFEAPSIGTMWTVISALTRACSNQPKDLTTEETHKWGSYYAQTFKLTDKQTNCVVLQKDNQQTMDGKKKKASKPSDKKKKGEEKIIQNNESKPTLDIINVAALKERWIQKQLKLRASSFTEAKPFR